MATEDQRYTKYATPMTSAEDIETLAGLVVERHVNCYPELEYGSLLLGEGESIVDDFYGTSKRGERMYRTYKFSIRANVSAEEMGMTVYAIDVTRQTVFHAAEPLLEKLELVPKIGDVVVFDGDLYEVNVARRWMESRVGQTEYYTIIELITTKAPRDFV